MNSSVYIFGELSSGYSQYPEDGSSHILSKIHSQCKATTQIAINREGNMMYYSYLRKLDGKKYMGLSIALNGYYANTVQGLFALFEKAIEELAEEGTFIHYADNGTLTTSIDKFTDEENEINAIVAKFKRQFEFMRVFHPLPPIDFSVSKDAVKSFTFDDDEFEIIHSSYTYGCTFIYKDSDYESVRALSHRAVLKKLNTENRELRKQNAKLQSLNTQIQRQKKQFRKVVILCIILLLCLIGVIFLFLTLNDTKRQLYWANNEVYEKNNTIREKKDKINDLEMSVDSFDTALRYAVNEKNEAESKLEDICDAYPFIVTKGEVSNECYSIDYIATEHKEITVYLKAINTDNGNVYTNSHSVEIRPGRHSLKLYFDYLLSFNSYYYVILQYNGKVIAGKYW